MSNTNDIQEHLNDEEEYAKQRGEQQQTERQNRVERVILEEEFKPLSVSGETTFLPSIIFPNTDRRVTLEETSKHFNVFHTITGTVTDPNSKEDQERFRDTINGILDETRLYTRSRICKERDISACRNWEWKVNGKLVNSYEDIELVLSTKWTSGRATMIEQCFQLMHGMYQTKKASAWFCEGLQGFMQLKRIKLYTIERDGSRKILPNNNLGRLMSFAKQARAKTNRDRNKTLKKYQGITIFSGQRSRGKKQHPNSKPVRMYDYGCDGFYIEDRVEPRNASATIKSLLEDGHTKNELISIINSVDDGKSAKIPKTVSVKMANQVARTSATKQDINETIEERGMNTEQVDFQKTNEEFQRALMGDGEGGLNISRNELDGIKFDLLGEHVDIVDTQQGGQASTKPTGRTSTQENNTTAGSSTYNKKNDNDNSSKQSQDNNSSSVSTVTEYSSGTTNNQGKKNFKQLVENLKPKPKKQRVKKPKEKKKPTKGIRSSPRRSPGKNDDGTEGDKDGTEHSTARRSLKV